jgi:hypothetical protein
MGFLALGKRAVVLASLVAIGACSSVVSGGGGGGATGGTGGTGGIGGTGATGGTGGTGATGGAGGTGGTSGIDFGPPPPVSAAIATVPGSLVAGDDAHLLAWCEPILDGFRVVAQRLAADGQPIDATPVEVTTFAGETCGTAAAHAPGGPFLVAWRRDSPGYTVEAARVSADLEVLDAPIFIADGDVVSNGIVWSALWRVGASGVDGAYFVSYERVDDTDSGHMYQQRVTTDGVLSSPPELLGEVHLPFALQVGNDVLQLWTDYTPSFSGVHARVGNAPPVYISTPDHYFLGLADAAFDGDGVLVVWNENEEPDDYTSAERIMATILDPSSPGPGQPFYISQAGHGVDSAVVAYMGDHYLVVWQDQGKILGARVAPDGTLIDPDGFVVSDEGWLVGQRLAVRDGVALVLYYVEGPTPGERVTYMRAIGELGP